MVALRICLGLLLGTMLAASARADVRVFVEDDNGVAWIKYACTAGEVVRAFALDVTVDRGQITAISDFFRGESQSGATGYGIFPAALRAQFTLVAGTNVDWNASDYTPLATVADAPTGTLPGLNSAGVTLEFGGLWDPTVPAAIPAPSDTLCALHLSEGANVTVTTNAVRGGVVSAFPDIPVQPVFTGGFVGPAILSATLQDGVMTVVFKDGELQSAPSVDGPWTDTGETSGTYVETLGTEAMKFYRVRGL